MLTVLSLAMSNQQKTQLFLKIILSVSGGLDNFYIINYTFLCIIMTVLKLTN